MLLLQHYVRFTAFFQENRGKPAPERETILDFNEARDDGVAMASAGPNENHLTSLQTDKHASTSPRTLFSVQMICVGHDSFLAKPGQNRSWGAQARAGDAEYPQSSLNLTNECIKGGPSLTAESLAGSQTIAVPHQGTNSAINHIAGSSGTARAFRCVCEFVCLSVSPHLPSVL